MAVPMGFRFDSEKKKKKKRLRGLNFTRSILISFLGPALMFYMFLAHVLIQGTGPKFPSVYCFDILFSHKIINFAPFLSKPTFCLFFLGSVE